MLGKKNTEVKISTLLGKDSECVGDFSAKGSVRLDGKITGDVTVTGTLIIGAAGSVSGNITAEAVVIGGEVLGNVTAPEKAELTETAKVLGDIATKVIVIDEHAVFQGKIDMNQEVPGKRNKPNIKAVRAGRKTAKAAIVEALKEVEEEAKREETVSGAAASEEEAAVSANQMSGETSQA